ncbi:MAG TPA: PEP-CTERM sorting domain-containing protein [Lacipirellulaceae bacterium]|nr:PEP-CTERM sorting domain-containing protein [Lacipirellulaceae bacterium]
MRCLLSLIVVAALAVPASAITVDGTLDGGYGAALAVQTAATGFGDASPPGSLGGSELDAAYATISGGRLYFMLTGNHEPNFNKLDVFIDSTPGGENTLTNTPQYDFFNGSTWISQNMAGLTFDTGFNADYHLFSRWGSGTSGYEADFINRSGGGIAQVPGSTGASANAVNLQAAGFIPAGNIGTNASGTALTQNLEFAIDDNNAAGVTNSTANAADALAVTTGMEFSIALADLGNPSAGSTIKIAAMINNGDHNYVSNQILGPLPAGQGNLGGDGAGGFTGSLGGVNLNNFAGLQYFSVSVVPEPATMSLVGLAIAGLLGARRRRK